MLVPILGAHPLDRGDLCQFQYCLARFLSTRAQIDFLKSFASRPNIFYTEIHEVDF